MPYKDIKKLKENQKVYRKNHKDKIKEYNKNYGVSHKEKISIKHKEYYLKHKEKWKGRPDTYYWNNKEKRFEYIKNYNIKNRKNWLEYLQSKNPNPICEVCGKKLEYFNGKNGIHFDHKTGNENIQHHPSSWMGRHPLNKKNIEMFESCNFGILCSQCNCVLPTKDRKFFMERLIKYVFGKNSIS